MNQYQDALDAAIKSLTLAWKGMELPAKTRAQLNGPLKDLVGSMTADAGLFEAIAKVEEDSGMQLEELAGGGADATRGFYSELAAFSATVKDAAESSEKDVRDPEDPPTGGEPATWELSPNAVTDLSTGAVKVGDEVLVNLWGGDNISSSSKNRPPLAPEGSIVDMLAGEYSAMHRRSCSWADPDNPIVVRSVGGPVYINPKPASGSDAIYFEFGGAAHFLGSSSAPFIFGPSSRASIKSEDPYSERWGGRHPGFANVRAENFEINGGFDWYADLGPKNSWGMHTYGPSGWIFREGLIHDIRQEHGGYHHNVMSWGPDDIGLILENVRHERLGRTGLQVVNRPAEYGVAHPDGTGVIEVRDCSFVDCGINDGGSAITLDGHGGKVLIDGCYIETGCTAFPSILATGGTVPLDQRCNGGIVIDGSGSDRERRARHTTISNISGLVGFHHPGLRPFKRAFWQMSYADYVKVDGVSVAMAPDTDPLLIWSVDRKQGPQAIEELIVNRNEPGATGDVIVDDVTYKDDARDGAGWRAMVKAIDGMPNVTIIDN